MQTKSLIREARLLDEALHLNLRLSALYWEEMAELSLDRPKIEQIQRLQKRAYGRWQRRLRKFGREQ